jgi:integrase
MTNEKKKLTDTAIREFKKPLAPKQVDYWDKQEPAFGVRVSYSGTKTFIVMVSILSMGARKLTRVTIGRYDPEGKHGLTLAQAREKARAFKKIAKEGGDPRQEKREREQKLIEESVNTFAAVREKFVNSHCKRKKQSTAREYERLLKKNCAAWDHLPITQIRPKDVKGLMGEHIEEGKHYKANRTFSALRKMFSWAVKDEILSASPAEGVDAEGEENARDRVLSGPEIKVLWRAFDPKDPSAPKDRFAPLHKLLLLTGQRRGEIAGMRRSELKDLDGEDPRWEIPKTRTKNKRPHVVHLAPMAIKVIKAVPIHMVGNTPSDLVFTTNGRTTMSGFSHAKARVEKRIAEIVEAEGIQGVFPKESDWHLHDLRRTVATHMAELGVSIDVIEKVLNHVSGVRAGIVGVYNRSQLFNERRKALNLWASQLQRLTSPQLIEQDRRVA